MSLRAVFALTLFLFLFAVPNTVLSSTIGLKDDTDTNEYPTNSSLTPRPSYEPFNGSISIESDSEFTIENGVSSGSGTQSDPYIIENLSFEVGTVPAIGIANTKAHLIIRNITVTGGRGFDLSSISLNDCKNILASGVEVSDGGTGIDIRRTSNIMVERCRSLTCNIGVLADDVTDLSFFNSTMERCGTAGCRLLGPSFNVSVLDNRVSSNEKDGMVFDGVFIGLNVTGNNVSGNLNDGIKCTYVDGKDVLISLNDLSENLGFGCSLLYCQTLWFHDNAVTGNPSGGILGEGLFGRSVNITDNLILNNGIYGMELQGVRLIKVLDNKVTDHDHIGIYLGSGSKENEVVGNDISGNGYSGLLLGDGADGNKVSGNNISGNYVGCYAQGSSDIRFEGNIFDSNTDYDCILEGISRAGMENNSIKTFKSGLMVTGSDDLDLVSNRFNGTGTVLRIDMSYGISVLDNAFHSTVIHLDQYSEVQWNLPERAVGNNIIGGPYRSGNYWEDYHGEDIDGDGIGDTDLPHGPGDIGPLVMNYPLPDTEPPTIIMTNFDVPVTGEVWTGRFKVHDKRSMFGVKVPTASCVQYDLHGNVLGEWTEEYISYDDEGRFSIKLDVQFSAVELSVNISAMDFSGNIVDTSFHLDVEDPIIPEVLGMDLPTEVNAGDELVLTMDLYDNVGIGSVEAIFDLGKTISPSHASGVPLNGEATRWSVSAIVPDVALEVSAEVTVSDTSGNIKIVQVRDIIVKDAVPPLVQERTESRPRTGEPFEMTFFIKDNHGLGSMVLLTSQDGQDGAPVWGIPPLNGSVWTVLVPIKSTAKELNFTLKAEDKTGNEQVLRGRYTVMDTISPTVRRLDNNVPMTGERFELYLLADDNWGSWSGVFEWGFDDKPSFEKELPDEGRVAIHIPENSSKLEYHVRIEDGSANRVELGGVLAVRDTIPPEVHLDFSVPKTSHPWHVYVNCSDNKGIRELWSNHTFGDGRTSNEKFEVVTGALEIQIAVPRHAWMVRMDLFAVDLSGLTVTMTRTVNIADGTEPTITGHDLRRVKDDQYELSVTATDNREVSKAWLILKDDDGTEKRILMKDRGEGKFTWRMRTDRLTYHRNYSMVVEDSSGLTASTGPMDFDVRAKSGGGRYAIAIFFIMVVLIVLFLLAIHLLNRWVRGKGRKYGEGLVWLSRGTGDMTRPREVVLPPEAFEE